MSEYHKIQTVFKRDPATKNKTLIHGDWSVPEFGYLANNEWAFTEKVDGTNIRVNFGPSLNGVLTFGGKTDNASIPAPLVARLQERFFPLVDRMTEMFPGGNAILYGEGYGAKIQNGGNYRADQDLVLFDVKVGGWWLARSNIEDIAMKLGLDVVPLIGTGNLYQMVERARVGFNSAWGNFMAEGIVARPLVHLYARNGERIITKIKHKDFA